MINGRKKKNEEETESGKREMKAWSCQGKKSPERRSREERKKNKK
jgi:hypothetical protein